jgi:2-polyprenyl-3-methyl-5-hydroxy-6-metoxy-1,4-benzoquinol methylase
MSKYDNYLSKHLHLQSNSDVRSKTEWISENYSKYLPLEKGSKILDIGPGNGDLIKYLSIDSGFLHVNAIDISKEVVDHCNGVVNNSTTLVECAQNFLEKKINNYDIIFMLQVLEHIPKDSTISLLSAIRNSLREGGVAIIEVPNIANNTIGVELFYSDFTHQVAYTDLSLKYVLNSAGFSKIEIFELKVPLVSLGRYFQYFLQNVIGLFNNLLKKVFNPSRKYYGSPVIYAVVTK